MEECCDCSCFGVSCGPIKSQKKFYSTIEKTFPGDVDVDPLKCLQHLANYDFAFSGDVDVDPLECLQHLANYDFASQRKKQHRRRKMKQPTREECEVLVGDESNVCSDENETLCKGVNAFKNKRVLVYRNLNSGEESNGCSDEYETFCESVTSITRGVSKVPVTGNFSRISPHRCHIMLWNKHRGRTWMAKSLCKSDDLSVFYHIVAIATTRESDHLSIIKKQLKGIYREVTRQPKRLNIIDMDYILCTIHLYLHKCYLKDPNKLGKAYKHLKIAQGYISHVTESAWTAELKWGEGELLLAIATQKSNGSHKLIAEAYQYFQLGRVYYLNQPCGPPGLEENVLRRQLLSFYVELALLSLKSNNKIEDLTEDVLINSREIFQRFKLGLRLLMELVKSVPYAENYLSVIYTERPINHMDSLDKALEFLESVLRMCTSVTSDLQLVLHVMLSMMAKEPQQSDSDLFFKAMQSPEGNPRSNVRVVTEQESKSLSSHTSEEGSSMSGDDWFLDSDKSI